MPFLSDAFTGEGGVTALNLHTPTVAGLAWDERQTISGGSANPMRIQPNSGDPYVEAQSGVAWWRNLAVPPTPDYYIELVLNRSGFGGNNNGAIGRMTAQGTFYKLELNEYSNQLRLLRINAWTETSLAVYAFTPGDGNHTLRLEMVGDVIKGYLAAVERINVTDGSPITGAGFAGMCLGGHRAKSIVAENLGAAASGGIRRSLLGIG
jgi:hypothetical protein